MPETPVPAQRPTIGRIVLVTTPGRYSGQTENAAIVTAVAADGAMISATLFPPGVGPLPLLSVYPVEHPYAGPLTWRWPDRP